MIVRYLVTLNTPSGQGQITVPSTLGPEVAGRRAYMSAVATGWGDMDEVTVVSSVEITTEEAKA